MEKSWAGSMLWKPLMLLNVASFVWDQHVLHCPVGVAFFLRFLALFCVALFDIPSCAPPSQKRGVYGAVGLRFCLIEKPSWR